jgi:branched-chain amino acid transport system permease protein
VRSLFLQQVANGLIIGSIYCLMAVGLTMIFGVMRISNFAHGEFLMLGSYFAIFTTLYLTGWVGWISAMFIAAIGVGLIGYLTEKWLFRPLMLRDAEIDILMLSIGLSIFIANAAHVLFGSSPRMLVDPFKSQNIQLFFFSTSLIRIFSFFLSVLAIVVLQVFLTKTKTGTAIRATSQNRHASMLMGIDTSLIFGLTFVIGSAFAGLSGVLYGTILTISPTMGGLPTLKAFAITIMGGMGSIKGAIYGGLILGVAEALGGNYISMDYKNAIGFIIIIVILLFLPEGLFGRRRR